MLLGGVRWGGAHLGDLGQFWIGDCLTPHRVGECCTRHLHRLPCRVPGKAGFPQRAEGANRWGFETEMHVIVNFMDYS